MARRDESAPGFGHLLAVDGQKAVRMDAGRPSHAGGLEHRGPEQRVEVQDVLADEVVQLRRRIRGQEVVELESGALAELGEAAEVADRRVEPDVEVLSGRIGDLEAEIRRVARYVPVLESLREPLLELARDAFLDRPALHEPGQPLLERAQLEEIMLRFAPDRRRSADHRDRILEIGRRVGRAAVLAGVSVLIRRAAHRANAPDVAIGQEHFRALVVCLPDALLIDAAALAKAQIHPVADRPGFGRMRRAVVVEADQHVGQVAPMFAVHPVDQRLRRDTLGLRLEHDGRPMGVVGADVITLVAPQFLESDPYIGLYDLEDVAQVNGAVCVRQGAGNQDSASIGHPKIMPRRRTGGRRKCGRGAAFA